MASKVKYPIRTKLLALMTGLVLLATLTYLAVAIKVFISDRLQLAYELNSSSVKTLSAQLDATLQKFADKVKLLTQGHKDADWSRAVFESDPDLVAFWLYKNRGEQWQLTSHAENAEYLKLYHLNSQDLEKVHQEIAIPFAKILSKKNLAWSSTVSNGAPIVSLGISVQIQGEPTPYIAVVDVKIDKVLQLVASQELAHTFVIDEEGRVVIHPEARVMAERPVWQEHELVKAAVDAPVAFQVKKFKWKDQNWIGAYGATSIGFLTVISQIEEKQAFQAAYRLVEKSLIFAVLVITISILLSLVISKNLTRPLEALVYATQKLSQWEFAESIHVNTQDEVADLARAFNSMSLDLKRQHQEIQANQIELERKVKERTQALEDEKRHLSEVQEALVRTTRLASLGELAGVAAHEILNPLNNMNVRIERTRKIVSQEQRHDIKLVSEIAQGWKKAYQQGGWAQLQKDLQKETESGKPLVEEDLELLENIARDELKRCSEQFESYEFLSSEISRVSKIVNNMRALSRVGGERRALDIHVALDETLTTLSGQLEKNQIEVVKDYGPEARDQFAVVADKDELVQVFANLVRNASQAVTAAKRRVGVIRVITKCTSQRIEIRISDNGTGIQSEHLNRIFEPNFTTKGLEEGTGLGLSISRRLVRAFNGDIEIEKTDPSEGTTFLVWFPPVNSKT